MTVVVDGSALVIGVADTTERGRSVRERLLSGAVATHLVDAEVGQAVRGLLLRGLLYASQAERSLVAAEHLVGERYAHAGLRKRAWQLRQNVSYYDGLYVALAEAIDLPLLTADQKLGRARGPRCSIEVV